MNTYVCMYMHVQNSKYSILNTEQSKTQVPHTWDLLVLLDMLVVWVLCIFPPAWEDSKDTSCDPTRFPVDGRQSSCFGVLHGVASES